MKMISRFFKDESGATAIEYAMIATLVSVGIIAGLTAFADASNTLWNYITTTVLAAI